MGFKIFSIIAFLSVFCGLGYAQTKSQPLNKDTIKATPAYAEILLRKVELESDVESFLESYTDDFPKVKTAKYELELTKKDLTRLLGESDSSKMTLALGKLLVRKNQLETELWTLQNQYNNEYPDVKRARRKLLIVQNAIKEILP